MRAVDGYSPLFGWSSLQSGTYLDGIVDKLFAAILAGLSAFRTLRHGVLGEQPPHHPRPALILTVHALLRTDALVILRDRGEREENVRKGRR